MFFSVCFRVNVDKVIYLNHGHFLELVKLIVMYDPILEQHLEKSIALSEKNTRSRKAVDQ